MSFLAGRIAGKEAAYFFEESKHAVNRLAEKSSSNPPKTTLNNHPPAVHSDVLPEILKHSLPTKIFAPPPDSSSLSKASKWALPYDANKVASEASPDILNPLRAYLSMPQVTFGPKRWELPKPNGSMVASTANEMRKDGSSNVVNPEKVKAAAEGLVQIGKAFAVATTIVFGGATLVFVLAASKLELRNIRDVRTKVSDIIRPKFEMIDERLVPLKTWVEETSKKWHIDRNEEVREKPIAKELSELFHAKNSN